MFRSRTVLQSEQRLDTVWYFSVSITQPCLKAVSYTGRVFVLMLLDYALQTNIKHVSTKIANSVLPVPQKLTACSSLCRSCILCGCVCVCTCVCVRVCVCQQITICSADSHKHLSFTCIKGAFLSIWQWLQQILLLLFRCCQGVSCTALCCHQGSAVHRTIYEAHCEKKPGVAGY